MPALSLIVCVHLQRDLLERLIQKSQDCWDDLAVVHDGPDEAGIRTIVEAAGGRFFERPRESQVEPLLAFAFGQTLHDWILRFDSDEFPSDEMRNWLKEFRRASEPPSEISGYTCIWPAWDGHKRITKKWPAGRNFLFHKQRVRFFAIGEQSVIPDGIFKALDLVLEHQPKRKTLGLSNVLFRKNAYQWRAFIAQSLIGKPTDLPCWRWTDPQWPTGWEQIRQQPLQTAARRLVMGTLRTLRDQWRADKRIYLEASLNGPIYHALICFKYWQISRKQLLTKLKVAFVILWGCLLLGFAIWMLVRLM
jgi:hypothetical protein